VNFTPKQILSEIYALGTLNNSNLFLFLVFFSSLTTVHCSISEQTLSLVFFSIPTKVFVFVRFGQNLGELFTKSMFALHQKPGDLLPRLLLFSSLPPEGCHGLLSTSKLPTVKMSKFKL
jgi:hypothetical protein